MPDSRRPSAPAFHLPTWPRGVRHRAAAALASAALLASMGFAAPAARAAEPFVTGDVMAGVGNGSVKQFSPTGNLKNTLVGTSSSFTTGMAFDSDGNLYVTDFDGGTVDEFDTNGNFLGAFITGITGNPESLAFDAAGNLYVGRADGPEVQKYDSTGTFLDSFAIATEARGSDWIDLAADQCTLFYTSEGDLVKRYDVCTDTQLSDFATLPSGEAYALRIRPNGDVIVAATAVAYRLSSSGALLDTYTVTGAGVLFGMNLDPDGTSFWTGDLATGEINRIDISAGTILETFDSAPLTQLAGLAVVGELRAAEPSELNVDDVTMAEGDSGTTDFDFTVTRSGDTSEAASVHYQTSDGTATAPGDYTAIADTTLDFDAGQGSTTVTVQVNGDTDVEADETFFLDLSQPTNATIGDGRGRGTITNDDGGGGELPVLDIDDVTGIEGDRGRTDFVFTVTRTGDTGGSSSVSYHTEEGTATVPQDFVPIDDGTLTFGAGDESANITVKVKGDRKRAPDERFFVVLTDPVDATIGDGRGRGTILADDPYLRIRNVTVDEPSSGFLKARFKVVLSYPTISDVTVHYRTRDGTATAGQDYVAKSDRTLVFDAGERVKYARIRILANGPNEPDETFFVELFDATGPDGVLRIEDGEGRGTIRDN